MTAANFGFEHLLAAAEEYLDADDFADMIRHAEVLATKVSIKPSKIQVGDSFNFSAYVSSREHTVNAECVVTKIEDGRVYFRTADHWRNRCEFMDGMTDAKLIKSHSPICGRQINSKIKEAWRFIPYNPA
jgi:hypothetical protein